MQSPQVSESIDISNVVVDFEEMVPFPDQFSFRQRVRTKYLATLPRMYRSTLSDDVYVGIDSTSRRRSVNVCHQYRVKLAIGGGNPPLLRRFRKHSFTWRRPMLACGRKKACKKAERQGGRSMPSPSRRNQRITLHGGIITHGGRVPDCALALARLSTPLQGLRWGVAVPLSRWVVL